MLSFENVICFKYLGVKFSNRHRSLFQDYNKCVVDKAEMYSRTIMSLVREGHDRAFTAYTLWQCLALPSILYGCEVIPLTLTTIKKVQSCQNEVGRFILQVPKSSTNLSVSVDVGFKPINLYVVQKVLTYVKSILCKPLEYWPRLALEQGDYPCCNTFMNFTC